MALTARLDAALAGRYRIERFLSEDGVVSIRAHNMRSERPRLCLFCAHFGGSIWLSVARIRLMHVANEPQTANLAEMRRFLPVLESVCT